MNNDHDILIKVQTILEGIVADFRAYRAESHKAIASLEAKCSEIEKMKVSFIDFTEHKKTNDARLDRLEKGYWMALGIVAALQFLAPILINKFLP
jgi:hypothetical protein